MKRKAREIYLQFKLKRLTRRTDVKEMERINYILGYIIKSARECMKSTETLLIWTQYTR